VSPQGLVRSSRPSRKRRVETPVLGWRLQRDGPHSGARNMAVDHALADRLEPGEGVLRLYGWARPTLSLGRNEPAGAYPLEAIRAKGMDIVRRPTGGRAVLHDAELTYAIVAPVGAWGSVRAAYRAINEGLAYALRSLGAPVVLAPGAAGALAPDAGPCFQVPAAGEVVASGRKLVGSAQARVGRALLQHGSILLAGSQNALGGTPQEPSGTPGPITLAELVPDVSIDEVAAAVAESLRHRLAGEWADGELTDSERETADRLERERYGQDAWTLRR
jgi:lipoate-protein ligase A